MAGTVLITAAIVGAGATAYSAYESHQQAKKAEEQAKQQQAALEQQAAEQQAQEEKQAALVAHENARRRSIATQLGRRGRASTILTDVSLGSEAQPLGGGAPK